MKGKNILTISSQVVPYMEETDISVMSYKIPKAVHENGGQIRIFMPRFGVINERRHQLHEVIRLSGINLIIDDTDMPLAIKVASIPKERIQVYFIDNDDYFKRKAILEDKEGNFFEDNGDRIMFFAKGVLETVKKLNWLPDIIHIHGWFCSLLPMYLKRMYHRDPLFKNSKVVTSLYSDHFEGMLNTDICDKLKQEGFKANHLVGFKEPTFENLTKTAIDYSDALIFGSEKISEDIESYALNKNIDMLTYDCEERAEGDYVDFFRKLLV